MGLESLNNMLNELSNFISSALSNVQTYYQLITIVAIYLIAFTVSFGIRNNIRALKNEPTDSSHPVRRFLFRIGGILTPFFAIIALKIASEITNNFDMKFWLLDITLAISVLLFFNSIISAFVANQLAAQLFRWIGLPIIFLQVTGLLPSFITILESISINVGNVNISAYGFFRVLIFGSFLFWLGRVSNQFGKTIIQKQAALDVPTKEVFSKLFEVALFCIIVLLLLNVMGINLTTLAVFGGALGVGIGLGLQSIASNFISGIIILLDRSLTVGDYVELDNGQKGFVREFRMRYAVLETYDGKDILVPNEMFISNLLINWSHKDPKQRYRVDFSVPYATDIRSMVEYVKEAVAKHPQVIAGEEIPIEERPDCEIDSFGDSGVNMFVEFWIDGIDDGKNRVGGDLLLIIFETLRENGVEMPFPQREVTILNAKEMAK
ncbi:MAG: mechanosensitive ion channel [Oleibacter sp.]|nr:mechanosensitive ion channel [Thalassolituus sp.]